MGTSMITRINPPTRCGHGMTGRRITGGRPDAAVTEARRVRRERAGRGERADHRSETRRRGSSETLSSFLPALSATSWTGGRKFSSRKARPMVPPTTKRKMTTGIVFGRGFVIVASSARRTFRSTHTIARRDTVRALLLLDVPVERVRRSLGDRDRLRGGRRRRRQIDQRQRDPVLCDDRLGRDLAVDGTGAQHHLANRVARRELRVQEREILEAVRVGDRDSEPPRLLGGSQRLRVLREQAPPREPLLRHPEPAGARPLLGLPVSDSAGADADHREQGQDERQDEPVDHELAVASDDVGVESEIH